MSRPVILNGRSRADFNDEELSAVLSHYSIGRVRRIDRHFKGSRRSPKAIVVTDLGTFLLKRRTSRHFSALRAAFSHGLQQHLAGHGFPLPRLIPLRDDDDTMLLRHEQIYELFEFVPGESYDGSDAATGDAGRQLARFHRLAAAYRSDFEPSSRGYHDAEGVRQALSNIPSTIALDDSVAGRESELLATLGAVFEAYDSAAERIDRAGYADWPTQIVHADWHPGNMVFANGRVLAVVDYDSLHLLPPITDVANGALQFSIIGGPVEPQQWPARLDEDRLRLFLAGYDAERPLPADQLQCLPDLMIEALIAEAVLPIAATGSFGRMEGFRFLQMIQRKVNFLASQGGRLVAGLPV